MEHSGGESHTTAHGGEIHSRMEMHSGPHIPPEPEDGGIRSRIHNARDRASHFADRTRDGVGDTFQRASDVLDRSSALLGTVRQHPLTSVGLAFSVGFVAAAVQQRRKRNWVMDRLKRQVRTILMSGLTAIAVSELRDIIAEETGLTGLMDAEGDDRSARARPAQQEEDLI